MDDLKIIELYFQRNEQAITETDMKYDKLCHSIAYNILNNHEDSEECVNDTYVGLWNTIPPIYFDSIREIVKRYSFTESKVKNMLFYTRNKLKDYLIKEDVEI